MRSLTGTRQGAARRSRTRGIAIGTVATGNHGARGTSELMFGHLFHPDRWLSPTTRLVARAASLRRRQAYFYLGLLLTGAALTGIKFLGLRGLVDRGLDTAGSDAWYWLGGTILV